MHSVLLILNEDLSIKSCFDIKNDRSMAIDTVSQEILHKYAVFKIAGFGIEHRPGAELKIEGLGRWYMFSRHMYIEVKE